MLYGPYGEAFTKTNMQDKYALMMRELIKKRVPTVWCGSETNHGYTHLVFYACEGHRHDLQTDHGVTDMVPRNEAEARSFAEGLIQALIEKIRVKPGVAVGA